VDRNTTRGCPIQVEQTGSAAMGELTSPAPQGRFDRVTHDRVEEACRVGACQHFETNKPGNEAEGGFGVDFS
jgi:hypothetical protein